MAIGKKKKPAKRVASVMPMASSVKGLPLGAMTLRLSGLFSSVTIRSSDWTVPVRPPISTTSPTR